MKMRGSLGILFTVTSFCLMIIISGDQRMYWPEMAADNHQVYQLTTLGVLCLFLTLVQVLASIIMTMEGYCRQESKIKSFIV